MSGLAPLRSRPLTPGERALAASMFGAAIDYDAVRIHRRKWWPLQPRRITMAPDGHLWFPPRCAAYEEDFALAPPFAQGHFIHEMTHVWQAHRGGRWWLVLMRHPFCRYGYRIEPGKPFGRYGIEQQAEIIRHAFLMRNGLMIAGKPPLPVYEALLPFGTS